MIRQTSLVVLFAYFLGGCASVEQTASLPDNYYSNTAADQVAVVTNSQLPAIGMIYPGANCLLCLGVAATANAKLSKHTQTFNHGSLENISEKIATALSQQGLNAKSTSGPNNFENLKKFPGFSSEAKFAKLDFRPLKKELNADRLVWIIFTGAGLTRNYASYIPTSEPSAFVSATVKMVDLNTNELIVNSPIYSSVPASGQWKEPPAYPGLTTAFYQAISDTESRISILLKIEL